jgi:Tfp pilus assembly protein PilO
MTLTRRIFDEKRGLIYPLLIALVLNAALFVAVLYPLSLKVGNGERSAQAAARELAAARRDFESARATVSGKAAADAELKKFYGAVLPPDQSAARRITYLNIYQLAKKANVNYERAAVEVTQERDSTLGKLTTTVVLSGQYRDIRHFIYNLETAPEFLVLENVSLTQGAEEGGALNVTVKVATYYQAGSDGI